MRPWSPLIHVISKQLERWSYPNLDLGLNQSRNTILKVVTCKMPLSLGQFFVWYNSCFPQENSCFLRGLSFFGDNFCFCEESIFSVRLEGVFFSFFCSKSIFKPLFKTCVRLENSASYVYVRVWVYVITELINMHLINNQSLFRRACRTHLY